MSKNHEEIPCPKDERPEQSSKIKGDPGSGFKVPDCGTDLNPGNSLEPGQDAPFVHHINK